MASNRATVLIILFLGNSKGVSGKFQQVVCDEGSAQTLSIPVSTVLLESVLFKGY